ncbi:fimbrial protein [Providencia manganoxydans]|uniref:fimbrial protein n=1 Tax=Providencia manganoxydans TaxID=2923283 RepID=UPI0029BFEFE8|nr:fimbrial protein [Providencia manganoxydans]MDX4945447.1 fimbrial protein [Providencia manganoxydans]
MMMTGQIRIPAMALWLSSLMPLTGYAVDVNFKANLIGNPPCDVAGPDGPEQPIRVQFPDVGITKINGENYRTDFSLTLSCGTGLGNAVALYLQYKGQPAEGFDNQALQASQTNLGVRLYHEGRIIPPNSGTPITMSDNGTASLPLYAVPVKNADPSATLYEGYFTATARVEINYP